MNSVQGLRRWPRNAARPSFIRISSGISRRFEGANTRKKANLMVTKRFKEKGPDAYLAAIRNRDDPLHKFAMSTVIGPRRQSYMLPVSEFYLASSLGMAEVSFLCIDTLDHDLAMAMQRWGILANSSDGASQDHTRAHTSKVSSGVAANVFDRFSDATVDWIERTYAKDVALYKKHCPESASKYSRPSFPTNAQESENPT